jgi:Centromere DNA-binding protein complex CBF3 subunit, domain 2
VYENKVIWFLNERVLDRDIRRSRYARTNRRTTADSQPIRQTLGIGSVKAYVASVVDLWSTQKSMGVNSHPHPRGSAPKGLLRARRTGEHPRRRLEFADRVAGILRDGYSEAKMIEAIRFCWEQGQGQAQPPPPAKNGKRPKQPKQLTEPYLRTALDFLLARNMLLRSESRLGAKLPDFFTIQLPDEGPTPCPAMVMVMGGGRKLSEGQLPKTSATSFIATHALCEIISITQQPRKISFKSCWDSIL